MTITTPNLETIIKGAGCALLVAAGLGHALTQHLGVAAVGTGENIALGLGVYLAAPIIAGLVKKPATTP